MIDDQGFAEQTLRYYERTQCSGQWAAFVGLFFDELVQSAGERDAQAFLRHLGQRLGQALALQPQETLEGLEAAMNQRWEQMDWGLVTLGERDKHLVIRHSAYPLPAVLLDAGLASTAMAAVLEGVYATWLDAAQGGSGALSVRCVGTGQRRILEFHYGRH